MKSCWIVTRDHKAVLEYREVPVPQPKPGEVIIEVHASALNRGELVVGGAVHGGPEKIGGNEAAGIVHAIGAGVTNCKPGDKVFGRSRGGFADYATLDAAQVMPMPSRLSWQQAAAIPISYITAYEMLYPPYGRLAAIILSSENAVAVEKLARELAGSIPNAERLEVYGPADAPLALVRGRRRKRLLVRADRDVDLQGFLRAWLARVKVPGSVRLTVDVDPYSFL
jgi:hypothetical protein